MQLAFFYFSSFTFVIASYAHAQLTRRKKIHLKIRACAVDDKFELNFFYLFMHVETCLTCSGKLSIL